MRKIKDLNYGNSYRVINYDEKWYAERLSKPGVWSILGVFDAKEKADEEVLSYIEKEGEK